MVHEILLRAFTSKAQLFVFREYDSSKVVHRCPSLTRDRHRYNIEYKVESKKKKART